MDQVLKFFEEKFRFYSKTCVCQLWGRDLLWTI